MSDDTLASAGLYTDELNKIRVLEPTAAQQTTELKEECKEFMDNIVEFRTIADKLISTVDGLQAQVEQQKMKAIGARNLLQSVTKQREAQQQQLQALITEKKLELERLRLQYDSLLQTEAEQNEFIEQLLMQK
ncbi:unnamed protein product [Darwinula stevensoni]|uniref:Intraflagellar transport 20 n=1 Tax=Darwinula stevensoni TaxID=69355 RepID=A0A7R8XCH2_9CRUS|nr:unnamed protein product [Darwinula stevensoni]CAG0893325.1 unnamed protein product [Darwinula stevensoni]